MGSGAEETSGPAAPFGLRFGMAPSAVPYEKVADVDFVDDRGGCQAELARIYDSREVPTLGSTGIALDLEPRLRAVMGAVRARLDRVADVTAAYYAIPFAGRTRRVCLGFYEEALYVVAVRADALADVLDRLIGAFDERLRRVTVYCKAIDCWRAWTDPGAAVLVVYRGFGSTGYASGADAWTLSQSLLSYTHIPRKAAQSEALVEAYERLGEGSRRPGRTPEDKLREIQRGFGFDR